MGVIRHRYVFQDPVRFGCLCSAGALMFVPEVPFTLTLLVMLVAQMAPLVMVSRALEPGWSRRHGRHVHEAVFAAGLSVDFISLAACTLIGALLLVRHFNGPEIVRPLGILTAGLCLLPDARVCRWLLSGDPVERSRQLREGSFLRDPVMLGALAASAAICMIDRLSLQFVLLSLCFLQVNTLLVFFDKFLPEIEVRRFRGWGAVLLEREARRMAICLAPLTLAPLRVTMSDCAGYYGAAAIAAAVVVPDLLRLLGSALHAFGNLFRVTPAPGPGTQVVLPRP